MGVFHILKIVQMVPDRVTHHILKHELAPVLLLLYHLDGRVCTSGLVGRVALWLKVLQSELEGSQFKPE